MINDPYVYPNSNVLKNKAKIKNQEELEIFETNIVTLRLIAIKKQKITI